MVSMRPAKPFVAPAAAETSTIEAGPTAVQVLLARWFVGDVLKIRKLAVAWSATSSPRPLKGTPFCNVIDQLLSRPAVALGLVGSSSTISFHVPCEEMLLNPLSGWSGLYR